MNDLLPIINSVACGLISLRLLTFTKRGLQHRPFISFTAYLLIVTTASVPIRYFFGTYPAHDISETVLNVILCIAVFSAKGNVGIMLRVDNGN